MWKMLEGAEVIQISCPCCDGGDNLLTPPMCCPNCGIVVSVEISYLTHLEGKGGASMLCFNCFAAYPIPRNLATSRVEGVC